MVTEGGARSRGERLRRRLLLRGPLVTLFPQETVATAAATRRLRSAQPGEAGPLLRAHPERVGASGESG